MSSNWLFRILAGVLLLCICVPFVSASTRTVVGPGSDVFIGEQDLDLRTAVGSEFAYIGWWAPGKNRATEPADAVSSAESWSSIDISPSYYSGRTGEWYKVNYLTDIWDGSPLVMTVKDPYLHSVIWDLDDAKDVSGKSVGSTNLTIRVDTNMYTALNPSRSNGGEDNDGYIRIRVKSQDGAMYYTLKDVNGVEKSLYDNNVWTQPYYWTGKWYTSLRNGLNYEYPSGTYTVWAESTLNGMKDNYKNAGADYVGKTVSASYTVIILHPIIDDTLPVRADYSVTPESGDVPLTVTFRDLSKGVVTGRYIEFGDGTEGNFTTSTLTHTYYKEGVFFPVMHAWNSMKSDTTTNATVSVSVAPGLEPGLAEAYNRILAREDILDHTVKGRLVYTAGKVPPATVVRQWGGKTPITLPDEEGYFFFIDDNPGENFEHPCRYVFVDLGGHISVFNAHSPPDFLIKPPYGLPQIAGDYCYECEVIELPTPVPTTSPTGPVPTPTTTPVPCVPEASHNYAILISGGVSKEYNYNYYYKDIQFLYKTLVQDYHYPKENVYVLLSDGFDPVEDQLASKSRTTPPVLTFADSVRDLDGDGTEDIYGAATKDNVYNVMREVEGLQSQDSLLIFTTAHGGWDGQVDGNKSYLALWESDYIEDTEFVGLLPKDVGSISMLMGQCYSGGFINDFQAYSGNAKTRVIATASNWNKPSKGTTFSFPWIGAIAMHDPNGGAIASADAVPLNGRISMKEAYDYAKKYDSNAASSLPSYLDIKKGSGSSQFLSGCTATPMTLSILSPNGDEVWTRGTSYPVTWSSSGLPEGTTVIVELWKGNKTYRTDPKNPARIVDPDMNNGPVLAIDATGSSKSITWKVPLAGLPEGTGSDYWVQIRTTGLPVITDQSDNYFNITAPVAPTTNLVINSAPVNGATISLTNGTKTLTGVTNKTLSKILSGTYTLRLSKTNVTCDSYQMPGSTLELSPGGTRTINAFCYEGGLNDVGILDVDSTVPGSEVYVDGRHTGFQTPVRLVRLPGVHVVSVTATGYPAPEGKRVTVEKGGSVTLSFDPTEASGTPIPEFPAEILPVALLAALIGVLLLCIRVRD